MKASPSKFIAFLCAFARGGGDYHLAGQLVISARIEVPWNPRKLGIPSVLRKWD
jgi:hypothetical protein